jgi:hypothetical protein
VANISGKRAQVSIANALTSCGWLDAQLGDFAESVASSNRRCS